LSIAGRYGNHRRKLVLTVWGPTIQWRGAGLAVLLAEFTTVGLLQGVTFFVQARKKDFL
jgi:hypothetical protein